MGIKIYLIIGVSGCGKTTIGRLLSQALGVPFFDGDDFHPPANVEKMSYGVPLTDDDRKLWLSAINYKIREQIQAESPAVFACSALKAAYRTQIGQNTQDAIRWIYLKGDYQTIEQRMLKRKDHFMPASLLHSQFSILEEPKDVLTLSIEENPQQLIAQIINFFKNKS